MTFETIRAAIWSSVSTDEQANPNHVSIPKQIEVCREYIQRLGLIESAGPFVADGYSRSFYEGLSEGRADIPPLDAAIRAADSNQYDVLVCYYFDRFRSLAYPVYIHLGKAKKQLRSVSEPTPIMPPNMYQFEKDTITATMIHLHGIKNDAQIGRLITQRKEAMPGRIKKGLPPSKMPYGYRHTNSKTPPEPVPEKIELLQQGRAMLLNGDSYTKIGALLGIDPTRVSLVYSNEFYIGNVIFNKTYLQRFGTHRAQILLPRSKWTIGKGQHEPIWTEAEFAEIQMEISRRSRGETKRTLFNKLLVCDECGGRLHWGQKTNKLTCQVYGMKHVLILFPDFFDLAVDAIAEELRREETGESQQDDEQKRQQLNNKINDLQRRRKLVQEGYESTPQIYSTMEASRLIRSIEDEIDSITSQLEKIMMDRQAQRQADRIMASVDWRHAREFFKEADPGAMNRLLTAWLKEIRVRNDKVTVVKR